MRYYMWLRKKQGWNRSPTVNVGGSDEVSDESSSTGGRLQSLGAGDVFGYWLHVLVGGGDSSLVRNRGMDLCPFLEFLNEEHMAGVPIGGCNGIATMQSFLDGTSQMTVGMVRDRSVSNSDRVDGTFLASDGTELGMPSSGLALISHVAQGSARVGANQIMVLGEPCREVEDQVIARCRLGVVQLLSHVVEGPKALSHVGVYQVVLEE
ncbi:hypothetical protein NE237_022608 [Protea cynaroides]|uniref:Uncharacterized protein n=1 Tax=Protea cynaroides TaxID=273540 RepID=A0A9Q0HBC3_9MAGN|nr:hypothetical protein NE237_022608 [Protea cynaroides]